MEYLLITLAAIIFILTLFDKRKDKQKILHVLRIVLIIDILIYLNQIIHS